MASVKDVNIILVKSMITSLTNPQVKNLLKLHQKKYRDESKSFLIEGEHLVSEALLSNSLELLIVTEEYSGSISFDKTLFITQKIGDKLSFTQSGSSLFGLCIIKETTEFYGTRYLLCDQIQDPGNLGTMIRSAHSFGFDGVIVSNDSVDFYNDKVIRATQGALFHVDLIRDDLKKVIKELKAKNIKVLATDVHKAKPLGSFENHDVGLIVGNEGQGVSDALLSLSDDLVKIETAHFESLNVAVASSILMYHFRKN